MDSYTEQKGRQVDIKQCLMYMLDHLILALIVGVVFAAALAGFNYNKQKSSAKPMNAFNRIISNNRGAYYPVAGQTVINSEKSKIAGTCIVRAEIYVEYNFSSVETILNSDYSTLISRFHQDSMLRMVSDNTLADIASKINSRSYSDAENSGELSVESLRWLINMTFSGANIMQYSVTDISPQRALDISELLKNAFIEESKSYETFNSVRVLEDPAVFFNDTDTKHTVSLKPMIKYGIVGGFLGVMLVLGICFIIFIAFYTVRTAADLEFIGLGAYGLIPEKKRLRDAEYKRIAYTLILGNSTKKILIVPVDGKTDISEIVSNVSRELSEHKNGSEFIEAESIRQSPEALLAAVNADGIVLAATYGASSMKDLAYSKAEMNKTGKEILGVVITHCKHL